MICTSRVELVEPTYLFILSQFRNALILFIETFKRNISVKMFGRRLIGSLSIENSVRHTKVFSGVNTFWLSTETYTPKLTNVTRMGALPKTKFIIALMMAFFFRKVISVFLLSVTFLSNMFSQAYSLMIFREFKSS